MSALERKRCLLMIKPRRPPFIVVVAGSAIAGPGPELIRMGVIMALGARDRCMREIDVRHRQLQIGRLVAFGAGDSAMRTRQREIRFGVIELRRIFPFLGGMAKQASNRFAARSQSGHALSELAFVYVLMATRATQLNKVIDRGLGSVSRLVAFVARHRLVSIDKREAGFLMQDQGVVGSLKGSPGVASLTTIEPRISRELAFMFIFMAVQAERKLDLVARFLALRNMAAGALYFGVRRNKRETCFGMIRCRICARYPTFNFMAALTLPAIGALQKLPAVRIRRVAIRALGKGHRRLEIRNLVASQAGDSDMLSEQRELSL